MVFFRQQESLLCYIGDFYSSVCSSTHLFYHFHNFCLFATELLFPPLSIITLLWSVYPGFKDLEQALLWQTWFYRLIHTLTHYRAISCKKYGVILGWDLKLALRE